MSSICTCPHRDLLRFPASDILEHKRRTLFQPHYLVEDGIRTVQNKLADGLDVRLGVCLTKVVPHWSSIEVRWRGPRIEEEMEMFDFVVLAVSPDVVASVFEPLRRDLSAIPVTVVDSVAHADGSTVKTMSGIGETLHDGYSLRKPADQMQLRSNSTRTEAVHTTRNGICITTNPLTPIDQSQVLRSAKFVRVLRTPESRQMINEILGEDVKRSYDSSSKRWTNGCDGVFLAGGWCWDGVVLLEGCMVSAMNVASKLGVEIPWFR